MLDGIVSSVSSVPFDALVWIICGTFAAIFLLSLILTLKIPRIKYSSKRPFLCLANAYAAIVLAAFLIGGGMAQAVIAAALFWCAGYICYGILCFFSKEKRQSAPALQQAVITSLPQTAPQKTPVRAEVPVAKNNVRLEHAISVTDRLLQKNLGKGDRQELEKLKNTLAVLQMKGALSPAESEILNENFNALLKLMAKYDV